MAERESRYDPWLPQQDAGTSQKANTPAQLQSMVDETVEALKKNLADTTQRGANLDTLQDKTDHLQAQSQGFRMGANRVRKQMWWKDMKMRICIIVGIIILLIVIIVPSVVASRHT